MFWAIVQRRGFARTVQSAAETPAGNVLLNTNMNPRKEKDALQEFAKPIKVGILKSKSKSVGLSGTDKSFV